MQHVTSTVELIEQIEFADFLKVDIRAGRIVAAEQVPKSDKLLKLSVEFGAEIGTRQIIAGIGKSYDASAIIGQFAAFVVNLTPRKMMGLESHGMILAGKNVPEEEGVTVAFLAPSIALGSRIG